LPRDDSYRDSRLRLALGKDGHAESGVAQVLDREPLGLSDHPRWCDELVRGAGRPTSDATALNDRALAGTCGARFDRERDSVAALWVTELFDAAGVLRGNGVVDLHGPALLALPRLL